jgi:hypothetical protein
MAGTVEVKHTIFGFFSIAADWLRWMKLIFYFNLNFKGRAIFILG